MEARKMEKTDEKITHLLFPTILIGVKSLPPNLTNGPPIPGGPRNETECLDEEMIK